MILPTHLTFEKSLASSPALLFAKNHDGQKNPISIGSLRGRGAVSDHAAGHGKADTDLGEWMPIRQDLCYLPYDASDLIIEFSLKYLPRSLSPYSCNNQEWTDLLEQMACLYAEKGGYLYQAYCQMDALFQGLPFWKNNDAESMSLSIMDISDKTLPPYTFEGLPCRADSLTGTKKSQFDQLILNIAQALSRQRDKLRLRVIATLEKDILEEVHPSQEFIEQLSESQKKYLHRQNKYQKTRHYAFYKLGDIQQAILHSTKIAAGLRWDLWNKAGKAVPVSVYSLDPKAHNALRGRGSQQDFYSLLSKIKEHIELLKSFEGDMFSEEIGLILCDIHFIMACLIKGGVYNRESSKAKKSKATESTSADEIDVSNP